MPQPLKVLIAEDNANDAELLVRELCRGGFAPEWERVETEKTYLDKLHAGLDLVLSDYEMPQFNGLRALDLLTERGLDVPFILVSGTIGEDTAVLAMKRGASDYLLKDRLARLGQAVGQALGQCRLRRERRTAEELVRQKAASMTAAQEVGHFGSWELDIDDNLGVQRSQLRWSAQCYRIFGFEPGEVEVTNDLFFSLVHPDDRDAVRSAVATALAKRQRYFVEHRILLLDGTVRFVREAGQTFHDQTTDRPIMIVGTVHDITEERRSDVALREKEAQLHAADRRLAAIVQGMNEACFALDADWRFTFLNDRGEALLRHARVDIIGRTIWEVFVILLGTPMEAHFRRAMAERVPVAFEVFSPIAKRWLDIRLFPSGDGLAAFLMDIHERKRAEEALRESEARFRELAENIHEVFWITDPVKKQMLYISPAYEKIWGRTCQSLYDSPHTWLDAIAEEDRARVLEASRTRQSAGEYDEEYRIMRPDGALRWVRDRAFPIKDDKGEVRRMVGVAEDVTERKKLEEQFRRAQRLEAIGTLSSGIAHDLNNILSPALMIVPMLKDKLSDPRDREMLGMIEQGAQRGANIVKQLLTFSRGVDGQRGPVQPRHLLREMVGLMRETFPREISVADDTPTGLWSVVADATQLHQVLMNLCVNARDAMPSGGKLTVSAANVQLGGREAGASPEAKPGPYVVMTVTDTGHGVPRDIVDRIFEPFFTTKEVGKGTGLGLSTVLGVVRSHGGFVTVYSEPGRGSAFKVYIPASRDAEGAAVGPEEKSLPSGRGELVLVVDDESAIRLATTHLLEEHNYRVLAACDGREALKIFLKERGNVRLVLTDLMMPVMGGVALIRAMRALEPALRVIATTGLDDSTRRVELTVMGVTEVLTKPCSPEVVLEALHRQLAPRE